MHHNFFSILHMSNKKYGAENVSSLSEGFPSIHKALCSIPSRAKEKIVYVQIMQDNACNYTYIVK